MATRNPRASSNAPSEAAARPLPIEETTPPVMNINLVFMVATPEYQSRSIYEVCGTVPAL